MHIESRLRMLERSHAPGACPVCGGKGKFVVSKVKEGEPDPQPLPEEGCPQCGEVQQIIIRYQKVTQIER